MFRFKTPDVITLFHKPTVAASSRVNTLLKQVSAAATQSATEGQPSGHLNKTNQDLQPFELNITEDPPTSDQLRSILQYVGSVNTGAIISGAKNEVGALRRLKENAETFQRPITVDWNNGRAVVGDNESAILKMLKTLPKQ